jgi:hypothetical protein
VAKQTLRLEDQGEWERQQQIKRNYEKVSYQKKQSPAATTKVCVESTQHVRSRQMGAVKQGGSGCKTRPSEHRLFGQRRAALVTSQVIKGKTVGPPRKVLACKQRKATVRLKCQDCGDVGDSMQIQMVGNLLQAANLHDPSNASVCLHHCHAKPQCTHRNSICQRSGFSPL